MGAAPLLPGSSVSVLIAGLLSDRQDKSAIFPMPNRNRRTPLILFRQVLKGPRRQAQQNLRSQTNL